MPANAAPSVLVTGIHTAIGEYVAYEFLRSGWFVIGSDASSHCSHFSRAHISADLTDVRSYRAAIAFAAERGNGIDCVVNAGLVPMFDGRGQQFAEAAIWPYLSDQRGSLINVIGADGAADRKLSEIRRQTVEMDALNAAVRVNSLAPYLSADQFDGSLEYRGADADAFLAHLNASEHRGRPIVTIEDIAAAVWLVANDQDIHGATFGADDSLPVLA